MGQISARLLQAHANNGIKRLKTDNDDDATDNGDESMHISRD